MGIYRRLRKKSKPEEIMKLIFKLETKATGKKDPDQQMVELPKFKRLWKLMKSWDIGKPEVQIHETEYGTIYTDLNHTYAGTTGTDIRTILDTLNPQKKL